MIAIWFLVNATVLQKVLDEHISDGIEDVSDVCRVCGAGQMNKYLLKWLNCSENLGKLNQQVPGPASSVP